MFPFVFFIDSNGDMWVPCRCSPTGRAEGAAESFDDEFDADEDH